MITSKTDVRWMNQGPWLGFSIHLRLNITAEEKEKDPCADVTDKSYTDEKTRSGQKL